MEKIFNFLKKILGLILVVVPLFFIMVSSAYQKNGGNLDLAILSVVVMLMVLSLVVIGIILLFD